MPDPPPADPFPLLAKWLDDALRSRRYEDANAMALATATPGGAPSVRMVLCKAIEQRLGAVTFFSNYESRKGQELSANPRAAIVFHWHDAHRQARLEGVVARLSDAENDAYFATRPPISRIGASVSRQSTVIASRGHLIAAVLRAAASSAGGALGVPRPAWWGGYRLRASAVELWCAGNGRMHHRVRWRRTEAHIEAPASPQASWEHELLAP
jgi:pyridoxamine 5'-phosphate oxidase